MHEVLQVKGAGAVDRRAELRSQRSGTVENITTPRQNDAKCFQTSRGQGHRGHQLHGQLPPARSAWSHGVTDFKAVHNGPQFIALNVFQNTLKPSYTLMVHF